MIFIGLIIPFFTATVLYLIFRHRTAWWEILIPLLISIIFVLIFKVISIGYITSDTEYLNDITYEARYYEEWNEWINETCYESCNCTTDSEGYESCDTCPYDCSYQKTHYEHWMIITGTGWSMGVSESEFKRLTKKFDVVPRFVDLNRDYDTKDGDLYVINWDGSDEKLECVVRTNKYENKTQVSKGVFNYPEVTVDEIMEYGLYEYPSINNEHKQRHLLGIDDDYAEHNLAILNGKLGPTNQLKVFVLIFDNGETIDAGYKQRDYWGGGNKNEFILTIGTDSVGNVTWSLPFTWSDDALAEVKIRNFVTKQDSLDLSEITKYMYTPLSSFKRKEFKDFDYLKVYPTDVQTIWCIVLTLLINIGLSIWIVVNEFRPYNNNKNNKYYKRRDKLDRLSKFKWR